MDINSSSDQVVDNSTSDFHKFAKDHADELMAIIKSLAKITSRTPEEIKPYLDTMLERLVQPAERPFYETATPREWVKAFHEWVESHRSMNLPSLSDEAMSRESIYETRD